MPSTGLHRAAIALALVCGCSSAGEPDPPQIRFWHTFNPAETDALNRDLPGAVESTVLPFARAQTIIGEVLRSATDCPDLIRIDATWLPGLARADLLRPVPRTSLAGREWLPEAAALARYGKESYGLPQALDGLALIRRRGQLATTAWPPSSVDDLVSEARAAAGPHRYGLGVRTDGYWFVAFARAWGGALIDFDAGTLGVESATTARALERFAALFGEGRASPPPPPSGNEADAEARRFRAGQLAVVMTGPWALTELSGGDLSALEAAIEVAPFPGGAAPRGGQLLVVPRCASRPDAAWKLALALTAPALQSAWAKELGVVPTTRRGLANAGALANQLYKALKQARPLPRHPMTPELFDDLNPAIAAVVAGDASALEALAGVARAWMRLARRHGVAVRRDESSP